MKPYLIMLPLVLGCSCKTEIKNPTDLTEIVQPNNDGLTSKLKDIKARKALSMYDYLKEDISDYNNFNFHLSSSSNPQQVEYSLKIEYKGNSTYTEDIKLRYILCGSIPNKNNQWAAECFRPTDRTIKTNFQPQTSRVVQERLKIPGTYNAPYILIPHLEITLKGKKAVDLGTILEVK